MRVYRPEECKVPAYIYAEMDYKEFAEKLQERTGRDAAYVDRVMTATASVFKEQCSDMDTISVQGFGSFEPKKKLEREVVNPVTGARMLIPPKIVLGFKPATGIKNRIKELAQNEQ